MCIALTQNHTRCKLQPGKEFCNVHSKEECIICAEERLARCFYVCACKFKMCLQCFHRMGKCPQCRHVYNERLDKRISADIVNDYAQNMYEEYPDETARDFMVLTWDLGIMMFLLSHWDTEQYYAHG